MYESRLYWLGRVKWQIHDYNIGILAKVYVRGICAGKKNGKSSFNYLKSKFVVIASSRRQGFKPSSWILAMAYRSVGTRIWTWGHTTQGGINLFIMTAAQFHKQLQPNPVSVCSILRHCFRREIKMPLHHLRALMNRQKWLEKSIGKFISFYKNVGNKPH